MTDLSLDRGNDRVLAIDATVSLDGVDLSFSVARRRGGTRLLEATGTGDGDGIANITLTAEDTADLPAPSVLAWDLEGVDGDGNRVTLAKGRLMVSQTVGGA